MPQFLSAMASIDHDSFCSAPPLILPPRASRAQETRRPRNPIWEGKREARESEYGISQADAIDVKPEVEAKQELALDPRQLTVRVAAVAIRPAGALTASSPEAQRHPLPSFRARMADVAIRPAPPPQDPFHVPAAGLGPGDPPRRPGRPKGSKSRPRIAAVATWTTPPVREAAKESAAKTRRSLMSTPRRS